MKVGVVTLGALLGAGAFSSAAVAQISPQSMAQGGILRAAVFEARASTDYNSNLSRSNRTAATASAIHPSDTVFTPSFSANIVQPIGRQAVFLTGVVSYNFHQYNNNLDSSRINVNGGLGGSVGPCGSVVSGGYARGRTEFDDTELAITANNIRTTKTVAINIACTRPTGIGVVLSGSKLWGDSSVAQFAISDRETTSGSAGVTYGRPSLGTATVFAGYSRTQYPNRPTATPGTTGFESKSVGLSYQRQLGGRIRATVSGGYTEADQTGPAPLGVIATTNSFSGVTYSGNLSYRASSKLNLQADLARSVSPTLITSGSYEVQTTYGVSASYRLGTRVTLGLGGARNEVDLNGLGLTSAAPTLTESRINRVFGSISYRQSQHASLVLSGGNERRKSDNPLFNYTNNRASLSVNYTF